MYAVCVCMSIVFFVRNILMRKKDVQPLVLATRHMVTRSFCNLA